MNVPEHEIDAGAESLRNRMQAGKRLTPWPDLANGVKRKWRDHAACVLTAAASAREINSTSKQRVTP